MTHTDTQPTASPPPTREGIDSAKVEFRTLWMSFLGQWGPRARRGQHRWRVQEMLKAMETVSDPFGESAAETIREEWFDYLDTLPGFKDYWTCGCSWRAHGGT